MNREEYKQHTDQLEIFTGKTGGLSLILPDGYKEICNYDKYLRSIKLELEYIKKILRELRKIVKIYLHYKKDNKIRVFFDVSELYECYTIDYYKIYKSQCVLLQPKKLNDILVNVINDINGQYGSDKFHVKLINNTCIYVYIGEFFVKNRDNCNCIIC